ncbi:MAG: DUF2059 domain-containing protein [Pseudolabrys sp.]
MRFLQATRRAACATVVAAMLAAAPSALAQQPSPGALAAAKELVAATGSTQVFTPLIAGVVEQAKNLFLQQNPGLSKDLNEVATNLRNELAPRFNEISDEVARLYATNFNEQELKEILAFYKSPAGKKLLAQQPVVVDSSMRFAQNWANALSDEVIAKMRAEMKKKGHQL